MTYRAKIYIAESLDQLETEADGCINMELNGFNKPHTALFAGINYVVGNAYDWPGITVAKVVVFTVAPDGSDITSILVNTIEGVERFS